MVTRKAITSAFELITNDKDVRTVTLFVNTDGLLRSIERVRVTRVFKGKQDFRVQLGLPNYEERMFLRRQSRLHKKIVRKVMVVSWPKKEKKAVTTAVDSKAVVSRGKVKK